MVYYPNDTVVIKTFESYWSTPVPLVKICLFNVNEEDDTTQLAAACEPVYSGIHPEDPYMREMFFMYMKLKIYVTDRKLFYNCSTWE